MTTAGVQVFNDSGTILLDQNYRNLSLKAKGGGTTNASGALAISVNGCTTPVLAVSSAWAIYGSVSSGTYGATIYAAPSTTITWYCFDVPDDLHSTSGLIIYNDAGLVVFDSNQKYARVQDVIAGANLSSGLGSKTYTSGRSYAGMYVRRGIVSQNVTTAQGNGYYTFHQETTSLAFAISGATITTSSHVTEGEESLPVQVVPQRSINSPAWAVGVIDVTGF